MLESALPSPCYLMDQSKLKQNLMTLDALRQRSGCRILFSQKAFSSFPFYSMIARYLDGASACSAYEAQLAHLYFHGENHVCQTAYLPEEMDELLKICDHITFNSPSQLDSASIRNISRSRSTNLIPAHRFRGSARLSRSFRCICAGRSTVCMCMRSTSKIRMRSIIW